MIGTKKAQFLTKRAEVLGRPLVQYDLEFIKITTPKTIPIKANSLFVTNNGTSDLVINRMLTIPPGRSFEFSSDGYNEILYTTMGFSFTGGGTNICDIAIALADIPELDNYSGHANF